MKKFILLCGISGSGKSFIANRLEKQEVNKKVNFKKLKQVTTREIREDEIDGVDYMFLSDYQYNNMKHDLISKTEFYDRKYGTIDDSLDSTEDTDNVSIIVVNREGRDSSVRDIENKYGDNALTLTIQIVNDSPTVFRIGRDEEALKKEKEDLDEVTDVYIENSPDSWLNSEVFINILKQNKFI